MLFALICTDKPASLDLRLSMRPYHLKYLESLGAGLKAAGPFTDDAGQPIVLPLPLEKIEITRDGTISGRPEGAAANLQENFQRIKLVNPPSDTVEKGQDGLFRRKDGQSEPASATVGLLAGSLEGSNVNVVDEMTNLIRLQRQFETQVKMMKTAEENDEAQNQLLRIS